MSHIVILILSIVIGLSLSILPNVIWSIKYGKRYISVDLLPLRKIYRTVSLFGLMLSIVSIMTIMEVLGLIDGSGMEWILLPAFIMSNCKKFFEPYYRTDVIDKIDDLCLYLRPFASDAQLDLNWKSGTLEKVLCGKFNKLVAQCYCIADPNSAMPTTLSTSGIYASDAEWKDAVGTLADKSKVILLRVMDTEGCLWEMGQCVSKHLEKTIFLVNDSKYFDILKRFIAERGFDVPEVTIINKKSFIALFYCNGRWCISVIKNKKDVTFLIDDYLRQHEELDAEIKKKKAFATMLKAPFKSMEIPNKWMHYITFFFSTAWYMIFNAWPITWIYIYVAYIWGVVVIPIQFFVFNDVGLYLILGFLFLTFLPAAWLAPRISMAFNKSGSKYLTDKINVTLFKRVGVYMLIFVLFSFCLPDETENETSYTITEHCEVFAEDILEQFGYEEYVAIETDIDSAFTSVYTDEQVIKALFRYEEAALIADEEDRGLEQFSALYDFYEAVDNVYNTVPEFVGWYIFQRFLCYDSGEHVEHLCLLLADKDLTNCYVFAIDDNERHLNFHDFKNAIDKLLSEETIEMLNVVSNNLQYE